MATKRRQTPPTKKRRTGVRRPPADRPAEATATIPPAADPVPAAPRAAAAGQLPPALTRPAPPPLARSVRPALVRSPPSPPVRTPDPGRPTPSSVELAAGEGRLSVGSVSCAAVSELEPQALGVTYWLDAAPDGEPYDVAIRFLGRRIDDDGKPSGDAFDVTRTLPGVVPGSGRIAFSTRLTDVASGTWRVTAVPPTSPSAAATATGVVPSAATGSTSFEPALRAAVPGVRTWAWPGLVGVGTAVALGLQAVLAAQRGLPAVTLLLISLVACLLGIVGAKVYSYLATDRDRRSLLTVGMCIQGFVLAAVTTLVVGSLAAAIPIGTMLDVTAPGLVYGMAIGRVGCFFGGCCAGRPTTSRWGLWSSDRSLGMRRVPVQLLESSFAATVATIALLLVLTSSASFGGVVFVGALSAYTFGRQFLFLLRSEARRTAHGRLLVMVVTAALTVGSVLVLVLT